MSNAVLIGDRVAVGDDPQRRVARRRNDVVLAGLEEVERLVGGTEVLHRRLAARRLLERLHPVDPGTVRTVLGVTGPGEDRHRPLARADARLSLRHGRVARPVLLELLLLLPQPATSSASSAVPHTSCLCMCLMVLPLIRRPQLGEHRPRAMTRCRARRRRARAARLTAGTSTTRPTPPEASTRMRTTAPRYCDIAHRRGDVIGSPSAASTMRRCSGRIVHCVRPPDQCVRSRALEKVRGADEFRDE